MVYFFLFMFLFLLAPLGLAFQGTPPPRKQINFWNLLFQKLDKMGCLGLLWPWLVLYERVFLYQKAFYPMALLLSLSSLVYNLYLKVWVLRWGVMGVELLPWWVWLGGSFLTLIRINLKTCQALYGALWVWRPELMHSLLENPWLYVRDGPLKTVLRQCQSWHFYKGPTPNLTPRTPDSWSKTHIGVGIFTATVGLGIAGSVAYDTRLARKAAEALAYDTRLAREAAEKAASAGEVSAGLKTKETHWQQYGKD